MQPRTLRHEKPHAKPQSGIHLRIACPSPVFGVHYRESVDTQEVGHIRLGAAGEHLSDGQLAMSFLLDRSQLRLVIAQNVEHDTYARPR